MQEIDNQYPKSDIDDFTFLNLAKGDIARTYWGSSINTWLNSASRT